MVVDKATRLLFRLHCILYALHSARHVSIDTFHELFVRSSLISSQASVNIKIVHTIAVQFLSSLPFQPTGATNKMVNPFGPDLNEMNEDSFLCEC